MHTALALLIFCYLLSGFVSTQVSLPAAEQVPIRIIIAFALALPYMSIRAFAALSHRSFILCFLTATAGYLIAAWSFSHAIVRGGYGIAVFVTSLPWIGLLDLALRRRVATQVNTFSLLLSGLGACIFFLPELASSDLCTNTIEVTIWSVVAGIAGGFAQYARRFHSPSTPSSTIADGVLLSAFLQAMLLVPTITHTPSGYDTLWLIAGGLCYFSSNRLANKVFAEVAPVKAAVWMSTEPAIALFIGATFLGSHPTSYQFIGSIVLCGVALYASPSKSGA